MKLEHLIQAYKKNNIQAVVSKTFEEDNQKAGVISYSDGITSAYLLDSEDIVTNLVIYSDCLVKIDKDNSKEFILNKQLEHTIKTIETIQASIELITNMTKEESNIVLNSLGLFDETFKKGKKIKNSDFEFKVSISNGLLMFSIEESDPHSNLKLEKE